MLVFGILFGAGGWGRVGASVKIRVKVIAALLAASGAAASAAFLTAAAFGLGLLGHRGSSRWGC